jgi:hypothetical protein
VLTTDQVLSRGTGLYHGSRRAAARPSATVEQEP